MTSPEDAFDFDALEAEIEIDRKVRLGAYMLEIDENMAALAEANRSCSQAFDGLEELLDQIEQKRGHAH